MKYDHTQINKIGIGLVILLTMIAFYTALRKYQGDYMPEWVNTFDLSWLGVVIVAVVYTIALNMMILRISVNQKEVIWRFGIGIPTKRLRIKELKSVTPVTNKWWYGWGIKKLLTGGWLYNVYGLHAVELVYQSGKIVRLGTDEPKKLCRAIESVMSRQGGESQYG